MSTPIWMVESVNPVVPGDAEAVPTPAEAEASTSTAAGKTHPRNSARVTLDCPPC
ncbi:MAG: hypothetical protein ACYDAD_09440 [Acidimicrobiales bacterium]